MRFVPAVALITALAACGPAPEEGAGAAGAASAEVQRLRDFLPTLEDSLPIDARYRDPDRALESPGYVAAEAADDARARFDRTLAPIAERVLDPALAADIAFAPWSTSAVMHELAHGLGPTSVVGESGERVSVGQAMREHHLALEEAKADVAALHSLTVLEKLGAYDAAFVRAASVGHLADLFRAARAGAADARGRAGLAQINYLMDRGALRHDAATGRFTAALDSVIAANRDLARDILTMQAVGDYDATAEFFRIYAVVRPEVQAALDLLDDVPVDSGPVHTVREEPGAR